MEEKIFSVTELNTIVKRIVDSEEMLSGILLSGEITNFKFSGAHAYFSLKDAESVIFCTYFNAARAMNAFIPKNGDKVLCRGSLDYYVKGGSMSFKVTRVTLEGQGALYLKFLELKEKLTKEGLFAESRKKPIPKDVKNVGVITSPTGAVIRDIINVTTRRNPFVNIALYPVKVQGEGAENEIKRGVEFMDKRGYDVLIVGRGGGSFEDLAPFNTELVARAVAEASTPIISAVGHETDFSLCDFASDLRAPTPSAAAELAAEDLVTKVAIFKRLSARMGEYAVAKYKSASDRTSRYAERMTLYEGKKLAEAEGLIKQRAIGLPARIKEIYGERLNKIKLLKGEIEAKSPMAMLDRGYAKVLKDGKAAKSVDNLAIGDELTVRLLGGEAQTEVKKINRRKI